MSEHARFSMGSFFRLLSGPLALAIWSLFVPQGALSPEAHRLAAVLAFTGIWWLAEPIPLAATGLAGVVLAYALGCVPTPDGQGQLDPRELLAPFADPTVFFLLGGMFIARAMTRHGLDRRLALFILCTSGASRSPRNLLFAIGGSVAFLSMWVSNTAATAMVFPVVLGIISVIADSRGEPEFRQSIFASCLLLMCAYASSVGGVSTPIGTTTNVVAMGFFRQEDLLGQPVDFARWSLVGLPVAVLAFFALFGWLSWLSRHVELNLKPLQNHLRNQYEQLGPISRGEKNTLAILLMSIFLWVSPSLLQLWGFSSISQAIRSRLPEEIVAILACVLLFIVPMDKRLKGTLEADDFHHIDWSTIFLFGSGLALGKLMFSTGLAHAIGEMSIEWIGTSDVWAVTAIAAVGAILLSEFTSNAATAATLIPVVASLCKSSDIDMISPLMAVTLAASFGSALPVSTPPNAIVYGSGLIPSKRMIKAGVGVDLLAIPIILLVLWIARCLNWSPTL